jgi:hypothetical protein
MIIESEERKRNVRAERKVTGCIVCCLEYNRRREKQICPGQALAPNLCPKKKTNKTILV